MGQAVIVFDCETTIDAAQQLNFGFCRVGFDYGSGIRTHTEICFYADDLPERDDAGFRKLLRYCAVNKADTSPGENANPRIQLLSRTEFTNQWLWPISYKKKGTVVGFNLPFDLSRLALYVGEARGHFDGGFSLKIWPGNIRPRLCYKPIDSKKAFIGFTLINTPEGWDGWRGRFLDLRTFAHALTGTSHSLKSACAAFSVKDGKVDTAEHGRITRDYIEYARRDVKATAELYTRLMDLYRLHDIEMKPEQLFSPASLSKAYYRRMGITSPLKRTNIDDETMGAVMSTFFGGRAECAIRKVGVPVRVLDFTSMYPTVNALIGGWDLLTSHEITAVDDTESFIQLTETITLNRCFEPHVWRDFMGIALIVPDGDMLPVRAQYSGNGWNLGVNRLKYPDGALWYAYPDIVASIVRTGRVPTILKALRFEGRGGKIDGMNPVTLQDIETATETVLDPRSDMFVSVVEKRQQLKGTPTGDFLKVFANSGSYGIFAEMIRKSEREPVWFDIHSGSSYFQTKTTSPEDTGEFCFPPLATCITSAARLMLTMLQRCISDDDGAWAFCDTDSTAVVCSDRQSRVYYRDENGRVDGIPVLHPDQVKHIRKRFDGLNPYQGITDLLKLEYSGECYAISAKRYALFHLDADRRIVIDKASNHGLGHLLNPIDMASDDRDWISQLWEIIIRSGNAPKPGWIKRPALSRYTVSNISMFRSFPTRSSYACSVKPANFVIIAHPTRAARLAHGKPITLYAPYETNAAKWETLDWTNKYDGGTYHISRAFGHGASVCQIQTYNDVLSDYVDHPEHTFNDRYGMPCRRSTIGRLQPCTIRVTARAYVGKEGNRIDDSRMGLTLASDVCQAYGDDSEHWEHWAPLVLPVLRRWTAEEVGRRSGARVSIRQVRKVLSSSSAPGREFRAALVALAATVAADDLRSALRPDDDSPSPLVILTRWADRQGETCGA